ncbi:hypothetical protein [Prevotella sp. P6B4]|uniref:PD-(D/E)XK nuclease domain-containing protein n=1 Tax=Prevotella sp. P6B4 TaxID=1410614 RepID=UPI0018CC5C7D|nr:hypothetical protein [Prevotella sp. P6B4]
MPNVNLEQLIKLGEGLDMNYVSLGINSYRLNIQSQQLFFEWERVALMHLQTQYPHHPQTHEFEKIIEEDNQVARLSTYQNLMGILKAFNIINPSLEYDSDAHLLLRDIFNNFNRFVCQLKRKRHDNRESFISDEYDVQDLLHAVLKLHFNDVRPEVWLPQYAGSSNRMDFFINDCKTAIEVKYVKECHCEKRIGEELLVDISKYSQYPKCQSLYCFIYDPNNNIDNPIGLETDLNKQSTDSFRIHSFVRPLD